jgi:hypothetical protein
MIFGRIEKDSFEAVIYTNNMKLVGQVHVLPQERLTDFLGTTTLSFVPLTDVTFYDLRTQQMLGQSKFLSLNKSEIIIIYPREDGND